MKDTRPNPECPECGVTLNTVYEDGDGNPKLYSCDNRGCEHFLKEYSPSYFNADGGDDFGYDQIAQGGS